MASEVDPVVKHLPAPDPRPIEAIIGKNIAKRAVFVSGADGVVIRCNQFDAREESIRIEYSTDVEVYDNQGAKDMVSDETNTGRRQLTRLEFSHGDLGRKECSHHAGRGGC